MAVEVFQGEDDAGEKEFGLFFAEELPIADVVSEISAVEIVHEEIEILPILKGPLDVDQEGMVQFG